MKGEAQQGEGEAQRSGKRGSKKRKAKLKEAGKEAKHRHPQVKSHQPPSQKRRKPKSKPKGERSSKNPRSGRFSAQLQAVPLPSFRQFPRPASGSSPAQPHHTIKGNEEQQPHSQPHPALQGRHSVVRTGENGYSSVITSAASRIACSSASESLVRGMSMSGVHSPRVCIITFSAVRDWPSERPAWYSFAISFVSS